MGEPTSSQPTGPWTIESRGRFTIGTCLACGFRTPARRARYSAEKDLEAHALVCGTDEPPEHGEPSPLVESTEG